MSDPRFARLKTDPRFRRPKKHNSKVVVDERFKGIFDEDKAGKKTLKQKGKGKEKLGRVDKFGRKISETHEKDNLRRFYRLEHEEDEEAEAPTSTIPDYARGGVLMESSESEAESQSAGDSDDESDDPGFVTLGRDLDEEGEIDLDESTFADLDAQAAAYARTAPEDNSKEATEKTRRLAVVNLDWDHVRAAHLYKIFSSLVSPVAPATLPASVPVPPKDEKSLKNTKGVKATVARGKVLSIRVYPSEFGKERIAREEKEGPPVEVFKKKVENEDDVNERTIHETGDGADYDEDALRKYQLERLRYYYAIVECDTAEAAVHIYNELEGTELERSANVFDLSFVPDEMAFDEEYRDEAIDDPGTRYRAVEFVTDALRHSKVKLTWDDDDPERNHITRRSLTKKEIEEADFKAYIASSSSESDNDPDPVSKNRSKRNAQRDKLRTLLLAGDDDELPEGWGRDDDAGKHDDVDMEITFTPGLTETKDPQDETTMEAYQRKMREKRKKRKEEVKVKATTVTNNEDRGQPGKNSFDDDFFEGVSGSEGESEAENASGSAKRVSRIWDVDKPVPRQEMKLDVKAEKKGKRKRSKKKAIDDDDDEVQDDFIIDVKDVRFKAIHEDYQFALDPSNPHFKKTKSMLALIDERTKRQKRSRPEDETGARLPTKVDHTSLKNLVESVKRKSAAADQSGFGKRRKL
ncbi:uncharacterized protein BJ212DRAFT_561391 [Suillus subaureus]|uniref:NUC153 domain-containing protein n=1 Tax=Suillus subaureus TaxID=48587 RepID=A0A9P7JA89_9AGAM|nr:uncharacterized protein BJ212DRAFT_561391 [Suillus subaureus]KAG1811216.1 hypothetical protein BJ212DRAFT_561391 [Suillus subaureus]